MNEPAETSTLASELESVCRATVGDELRSITYFTDDGVQQVYLRADLDRDADLVGFAEVERTGFWADERYRETELGEYRATIRMFENGYLTSVVFDHAGVWVTADAMSMDRFEELSSALKSVLRAQSE